MISYTLTLANSGNVKLRALQVVVPELGGNSSLNTITCLMKSAAWPANGDLEVGQQLVCSSSFAFTQVTVEAGDITAMGVVTASNLVQRTVALPAILVANRPSLTVTVDPSSCVVPSRAGERAWVDLGTVACSSSACHKSSEDTNTYGGIPSVAY